MAPEPIAPPNSLRLGANARLFSVGIFVNAALLFSMEPMFARMVLPVFGGSAMVWTTCLLFFQASLLAGYVYAWFLDRAVIPRWQPVLHLTLIAVAAIALPISIPSSWRPAPTAQPVWPLIALLTWRIGGPFIVLSAGAPLFQRWYSGAAHRDDGTAYSLYAVSNAGSVVSLLAYPFLVEPRLRLSTQASAWSWGYGVLALLVGAICVTLVRGDPERSPQTSAASRAKTPRQRMLWIALAAAPASLLMGVTTHLSTDLAPIPVLWVVPLALYLLAFVAAFGESTAARGTVRVARLLMPYAVIAVAVLLFLDSEVPGPLGYAIHCVALYVCAVSCHARLADTKPPEGELTSFYLWIAVGGVIGGVFNAIAAPALFTGVAEYPIALVACAALGGAWQSTDRARDLLLPSCIGLLVVGASLTASHRSMWSWAGPLLAGGAALVIFSFRGRPLRFSLGVAALLGGGLATFEAQSGVALRARSFYGVYRVVDDVNTGVRQLYSGTTVHGSELLTDRGHVPLTYYHRDGPVGSIFDLLDARSQSLRVAVIGLGAGSMAAYARPGDAWTLYEIDPLVAKIARDTSYFHFLASMPERPNIVLGDARLSLASAPPHAFDLIAVDAFSSDAIPVHLLTREALELYRSRLSDSGMIAWHISNKYLDLRPVLAGLASDAGLTALIDADVDVTPGRGGRSPSVWVVMTSDAAAVRALSARTEWSSMSTGTGSVHWSDDYSSVASLLMARQPRGR